MARQSAPKEGPINYEKLVVRTTLALFLAGGIWSAVESIVGSEEGPDKTIKPTESSQVEQCVTACISQIKGKIPQDLSEACQSNCEYQNYVKNQTWQEEQ